MTAERASVVSATRIVGSGPIVVKAGEAMMGVVADGDVQTGCVRRGRVSCCCADAMGRKSDCASTNVMTRRARELHIMRILLQNPSTDYTDFT